MKNDRRFPLNTLLRAARDERGWSQQELADQITSTPVNVSRWENGLTFPSPYFRQRMCDVFGKTPAELGLLQPSSPPGSKLWNIPIAPNPFFTGREHLLELLLERLSAKHIAALTQTQARSYAQALYGLGGIGKTQTAAEFAFRYSEHYAHVFWLQADTGETLLADFVALAELLELPHPQKDEQYQKRVVAAVKRWLADNDDWLLILDNADDLPMAQQFLPTKYKGYVLFTTRAQAAGPIAASIEVEKLNLEEGTLLLLRASKRLDKDASVAQAKAEDRAAAEQIVQEMDGLPLALVQAAAFIDETGCSLADYLSLYATHRKELLERPSSLMINYSKTVATTWSLSFQHIEQQSPLAANLLRLCAFLAPDAIPEELFTRGAIELRAIPGAEAIDSFQLYEALAALRKYSLLRLNSDGNMLNMHRLVQAVLKESMDLQTRRFWAERTLRVVNAAFPETDYAKDSPHQYYLLHVQECATLINEYHLHFPEAARLLYRAGISLYSDGFYPQSQAFQQQALTIREQVFESDHPEVADSLNALAMLASNQGDYERAERFYWQALNIREKTLGPHHPTTAESLNNLSVLYRTLGKYEQAERLLKKALSIHEQSLGSEDPITLNFVINLAKLYAEQRQYEQAEQLLNQALATGERVLEPEHPLIAHNLNLLARLSFEQGNYERAESLWKRSLAILEKTLGSEHPAAAERLSDLAELYLAQHRYAEAQSLCQRAFSICELGPENPDTITVREQLSRIMSKIKGEQDHGNHPTPSLL